MSSIWQICKKLRPIFDGRCSLTREIFTRQTMVLLCEEPDSEIRVNSIFSNSLSEAVVLKRAKSVAIGDAQVRLLRLKIS